MAKYSSEQSVLDVIATASDAIGFGAARMKVLKAENERLETALRMYIGRSEGLLARNEVLEKESAELRKKLQEARDDELRAELALENLHAAMTKIASCPCRVSDTDCGVCVSCIARAALGVDASNERMINRENFKYWKKP